MKLKRENNAVSEIIGTIMLLSIAVILFTGVYVFVLNEALDPHEQAPNVNIVGTTEGKDLIFENRGGESLSSDTLICFLSVAGKQMNMTIGQYLEDTNGNGEWDVGERLVFNSTNIGTDIIDLQVDAAIIDKNSDTVIMEGTIQEGEIYEYPYVITLKETDVESDRAKFWMEYNFRGGYSGDIRFAYKAAAGGWNYTSWLTGQSGAGTYGITVTSLIPETVYQFKAQLKYDNLTIEGSFESFTTLGIIVGEWHFDTGSGTTAFDSCGRNNHGTLYYGPQWLLGVNGTALRYDGIDDYVRVDDHSSLDITDEITIEAWMKPLPDSEGYYGKITGSILDSSYFGIYNIYDPDLIHVSGDIYAIACRGDGNDGFLVTVEIANDGKIKPVIIDKFEFSTADCYDPDIININGTMYAVSGRFGITAYVATIQIFNDGRINPGLDDYVVIGTTYRETHIYHITGDIYAITYTGPGNDGYITSINIDNFGQITGIKDTIVFDSSLAGVVEEIKMIHVSGDVYAIVYRNADSDGEMRTLNIASDGQITAPSFFDGDYIDNYAFDIFDGFEPTIIRVNGNVYAIAYGGFDQDGMLRTLTINPDGTIVHNTIDALEFDTTFGRETDIIHINGNIFAISYRGPDYDGWLVTVDVANNGTIVNSVVDSFEFETSTCYDPEIIHVNGDIYAISFRGIYNDGFIKTIRIAINGTITKQVVDYSEFSIYDCQQPDIINISNNIYALVYTGLYSDGYIRTIEIANNGQINDTTIDGLRFDTGQILDPMIIHISGDVYAITYSNYSGTWEGNVITVRINNSGYIIGIIDILKFETSLGLRPDITHVSGDVYAVAYRGPSNDGYIKTIRIANDGTFPVAGVDSEEFDTSDCYYPDIFHISGNIYAIAYTGYSWDGYLKTVMIANDGTISPGSIDTIEFDTSYCVFSNMINVTGDIYAIAYTGPSTDGYVKTVEIASNGTIIGGVIDSLEYDTSHSYRPDIIRLKGRAFAVTYAGPGWDGYIKTFRIGENGEIINSADSSYEFDTWDSRECKIIHINGNVFAIAYRNGWYTDGMVRTVEINYVPSIGYIISRSNCYGINANSTMVFAWVNGVSISAPISPGYNYVVLTYDKNAGTDQMKLYINTTLMSWTTYSSSINTNNNHLYFGWLNSEIDEVILWRSALTQADINQRFIDLTS